MRDALLKNQEYRGSWRWGKIVRYPEFPGMRIVVEECAEDIMERSHQGRLSPFQRMNCLPSCRPIARGWRYDVSRSP